MILMLSGTSDGRELGLKLAESGCSLIMTAVSDYGSQRLPDHDKIEKLVGGLSAADMAELIKKRQISLLLDATHPYATDASLNAIKAAETAGIDYVRYERPDTHPEVLDNILYMPSYEAAADWLADKSGTVFLTIGSRRQDIFVKRLGLERLVTRVLPTVDVMALCKDLGLKPNQIIAMQGPFKEDINMAMFKMYRAKYLVTKASSNIGGFEEKLIAASKSGMTTLVVERPQIEYPTVFYDIQEIVDEILGRHVRV